MSVHLALEKIRGRMNSAPQHPWYGCSGPAHPETRSGVILVCPSLPYLSRPISSEQTSPVSLFFNALLSVELIWVDS